MRILAIRGGNLASLPQFDLDFEAEPIRGAGIFAITGPTGAGKSTILDAICLAFFDRLPRLVDAEKKAKISRGDGDASREVSSADVRNILRHGCGDGFAEVDFIDQDGRKCRARWSVHRSRSRPDGALQAQAITLTDLITGEAVGQGKSDTLAEIQKRVGLGFDQFRRAAMLAQNEFDMFIRSDSNARSSLLERITGTEVYSLISCEAYERAKLDRGTAERIEEQLQTLEPLDERARQEVEDQIPTLRASIDRLSARRMELDQAKMWYETDADLVARVTTGREALACAEEADRIADAERAELARSRRAFSARSELDAADGAQRDFDRAVEHNVHTERVNVEAMATLEQAALEASYAQEAMLAAQREYDEIGPELTRATGLDARIDVVMKELNRRAEIRESAVTRAELALSAMDEALEAAARNVTRVAGLRSWLDEHQSSASLASHLEEVVKNLQDWGVASSEMERAEKAITTLGGQRRDTAYTIETKSVEKLTAVERERVVAGEIASIEVSLSGIDRAALNARRDAALRAQAVATEERHWSEELEKTAADVRRLDNEEMEQARAFDAACETAAIATRELPVHEASLREAQRALNLSAASAEETTEWLRLQLVEGEPCPVCGATSHHTEFVDDVLRTRVASDQARVGEIERLVREAMTAKAQSEAQQSAALRDIERLHREHSAAEAARERAVRKRDEVASELANLVNVLGVSAAVIGNIAEDAEKRVEVLDALERSRRDLSAQRETIRHEIARLDRELTELRQKIDAANGILQTKEIQFRTAKTRRDGAGDQIDRVLADVLSGWRTIDPVERAIEQSRRIAADWNESTAELASLRERAAELALDVATKRAESAAAEGLRYVNDSEYNEKVSDLAALRDERAGVIGGRAPGEVRTEYRVRAESANERWHDADDQRSRAKDAATVRTADMENATKESERCRHALRTATEVLDAKLDALQLDVTFARDAIQRGEAWADAKETQLALLRQLAGNARAIIEERQAASERHRASGHPSIAEGALTEAMAAAATELKTANDTFTLLNDKLRRDKECGERAASLRAGLKVAIARSTVSQRLSALIGSSDGRRFRDFAQSLTFERLVDLANSQLRHLYPRYELARTRGNELALQVIDHDMADEVRGVHSLSGGERFLVSLALALGLASMSSAQGVKVESLFIDEGFGALDSNSLNMALAVLEQLQAGGRLIGIISHIDVLQERIGVRVAVTPEGAGRSRVEVLVG